MSKNDGTPDLTERIDIAANDYVFDAYRNGYPELDNSREELLQEMLSPAASPAETTYQLGLVNYKHVVAAFARYTYEEVMVQNIEEQKEEGAPMLFVLQRAAGVVASSETTRRHLAIMKFFVPHAPEIASEVLPVTYKAGEDAALAFNRDILAQQANNGFSNSPRKGPVEVMSTTVEGFVTSQIVSEQNFINGMFKKGL